MRYFSNKHVENKQIEKDDIIRLASVLEEYKNEWLQRASAEEEYNNSIKKAGKKYDSYSSSLSYNIAFNDGRDITEPNREWFLENINDIDNIERVYVRYSLSFFDYSDDREIRTIYVDLFINKKKQENRHNVGFQLSYKNLDDEGNILHKQLQTVKEQLDEKELLTASDICKIVGVLESHKKEYDYNQKQEDELSKIGPTKNEKYSSLKSNVTYTIEWYDGKDKTEKSYDWFLENMQKIDKISKITIEFSLNFRDEDVYKTLSSSIYFKVWEKGYDSSAVYGVDSGNMDSEADALYSKIESVFHNCPTRYDGTIKNRGFRIQGFSIAVGIILSYVLYIALKIALKDSDGIFYNLLHNKNVLVFGQWIVAIVFGNVLASWYINMLYSNMLPERKYVRYDRSNHKSVYKDEVEDYIADSELHIGKFADLGLKRNLIKKLYKYSIILIGVQIIISVILFLLLK